MPENICMIRLLIKYQQNMEWTQIVYFAGIYAENKIYVNYLKKTNEIIQIRFKGVGKDDKYIPNEDVPIVKEYIKNNELNKLNEYWNNLSSGLTINTIKLRINKNQNIYIMWSI